MSTRQRSVLYLLPCMVLWSCNQKEFPLGTHPSSIFVDQNVIAFCMAAVKGDMRRVKELLDSGINIHEEGRNGVDLLMWSLEWKDVRVFECLLRKGANPNRQLPNGDSVMRRAACMENEAYLTLALKNGGDPNLVNTKSARSLLVDAIMHNRESSVRILLAHGANVDQATRTGDTAAMTAACVNRYDVVLFLLEHGADPNRRTSAGIGIIEYLQEDIQNPNLSRNGPHWDAKLKVVDLLEGKGVDVSELRRLIATPPAKNTEPLIREYRSW